MRLLWVAIQRGPWPVPWTLATSERKMQPTAPSKRRFPWPKGKSNEGLLRLLLLTLSVIHA